MEHRTIPTAIDNRLIVLAYLFPVDESTPRRVQVEFELFPREGERAPEIEMAHRSLSYRMLLEDVTRPWSGWAQHTVRGRLDSETGAEDRAGASVGAYDVVFREAFARDGSRTNRCIANITNGQAGYPWAGNVLAVKRERMHADRVVDISEQDLSALVAFFREHRGFS